MATADATVRRPRAATLSWSRLPVWLRRTILFAVLIALWQAYVSINQPNPLLFASPWQTANAFWEGWSGGSLANKTWTTVRILAQGIGIGAAIAAVLTAFATLTKVGDDLLTLLTSILNPLPGVAVLPLAMLWFGLNTTAVLFVIANATV